MVTDIKSETNKVIARRMIEEVFQQGDEDAIEELVAEDFVPHNWASSARGRDAVKQAIGRAKAGLSDPKLTVDDVIAEDDKVAVRVSSSATQSGPFMGLPPSGKSYDIEEIHIFRIEDGKVAEHWHQGDWLGMMRQLGALPGPGPKTLTERRPNLRR